MDKTSASSDLESAILSRVIDPDATTLSSEAARSILALWFPDDDLVRMNALAAKARAGNLRPDEDTELDSYLRVRRFLALVQTKARQSLQRRAGVPA